MHSFGMPPIKMKRREKFKEFFTFPHFDRYMRRRGQIALIFPFPLLASIQPQPQPNRTVT